MGIELSESIDGKSESTRAPLHLGVVNTIPRSLVYRLLEPALRLPEPGTVHLHQGNLEQLLSRMSAGGLHLILAEEKPPQGLALHLYCRPLVETGVCLYRDAALGEKVPRGIPAVTRQRADAATKSGIRSAHATRGVAGQPRLSVRVVGEFDDIESMRVFGSQGHALLPAHATLQTEAEVSAGLESLGVPACEPDREHLRAVARAPLTSRRCQTNLGNEPCANARIAAAA